MGHTGPPPRGRRSWAAVVRLALLAIVAASCGDDPTRRPRIDLEDAGPLEALQPCAAAPAERTRVRGIVLPPQAVVVSAHTRGRLTRARGYVPLTPIAFRKYYERLRDVKVFLIEDEVYEAEVFLARGRFATFVKATAVCRDGSRFIAFVAPEKLAGDVPAPARTGTDPNG